MPIPVHISHICATGSCSNGVSTWMPDAQISRSEDSNVLNSTQMSINNKDNDDSPLWIILMDQSQLVMTVVGLVANMATTLTLIKNGQVCRIIYSAADFSLDFC